MSDDRELEVLCNKCDERFTIETAANRSADIWQTCPGCDSNDVLPMREVNDDD